MIIVTAGLLEKDGLILAARRKPGKHMAGHWEFPGGKQEQDESPQQCLQRELKEELGIDCRIDELFGESIHTYEETTIQLLCFKVTYLSGALTYHDHDKFLWLEPEKLENLKWAPADIPLVQKLIQRKSDR